MERSGSVRYKTNILLFSLASRLSDKAHSVIKEAGHVTLEPVTNNGNYLVLTCISQIKVSFTDSILQLK